MIVIHQFPPLWGLPNPSPFCLKLETWLRMAGIPYAVVIERDPGRAPKGKLPFIEDQGRLIGDSNLIVEHLAATRGIALDDGLSGLERAAALAFRRLIEENLYWVLVYSRWVDPVGWEAVRCGIFGALPPLARTFFPFIARGHVMKQLRCHGLGRHEMREIYHIGRLDLIALADFLGDKPYFLGDHPTSLDASAYGLLANILVPPIDSPLKAHTQARANLCGFHRRMRARYWPLEA